MLNLIPSNLKTFTTIHLLYINHHPGVARNNLCGLSQACYKEQQYQVHCSPFRTWRSLVQIYQYFVQSNRVEVSGCFTVGIPFCL